MADTNQPQSRRLAEPPGGGKEDHEVMRAASTYPLTGASDKTLAASSGLEVPAREAHPVAVVPHDHAIPEPIPGEHDATTLTHREPGSMGGRFNGADIPAGPDDAMIDAQTAHEHSLEGGGADGMKIHEDRLKHGRHTDRPAE